VRYEEDVSAMVTMTSSATEKVQDFIQDVYAHSPVGLCYFDSELRYLQINEWLARINGLSVEEHLGRRIQDLFPQVAADVVSQLRQVIETGEPIVGGNAHVETPAHPGEKRFYEHNYYPRKSDDDTVVGVSCAVQDVTERNLAEAELRSAVKARDDLLAIVSHDLGNPIAVISMVTERLLAHPEEEDRREQARLHLEGIAESTKRMERLVHDLLEIHTLETGRRWIRPTKVSVQSIVAEIVRAFGPVTEVKSITLTAGPGKDWVVRGDRDRVLEVLSNLLENSVKFTAPKGKITLEIELREGDVLFSVSDTGLGIAPEQILGLFDRYVQAREKRRAGAGLGLAIAKEIVEAHGGSIWCESELGVGTTFFFTLPKG
jgi:PAS domain S-box-containing protein